MNLKRPDRGRSENSLLFATAIAASGMIVADERLALSMLARRVSREVSDDHERKINSRRHQWRTL
jgi:hypothetical protein